MNKLDYKHIAFHVLVGLYFIWLAVFGTLITLSIVNIFTGGSREMNSLFLSLVLLNIFMGSALYIVIRLFRYKSLLTRVIAWSFGIMAVASVTVAFLLECSI